MSHGEKAIDHLRIPGWSIVLGLGQTAFSHLSEHLTISVFWLNSSQYHPRIIPFSILTSSRCLITYIIRYYLVSVIFITWCLTFGALVIYFLAAYSTSQQTKYHANCGYMHHFYLHTCIE